MVTSSADLSMKVWKRVRSPGYCGPWFHLSNILGCHARTILSVHWSSEGIIASGAADGSICFCVQNQDGLSQKRSEDMMYKLILTKEKAHETDVNSVQQGPKKRSEAMFGMELTEKAHIPDVNSVQHLPTLQKRSEEIAELLLPKEKEARETEVTAVQWAPKEIRLLASSSDNGTIKIWDFTRR